MSFDATDLIGRMIVPAAVVTVLALLRRYMPARKTDPQSLHDRKVDVEEFRNTSVGVYSAMVVVMIAFAFFSHQALVAANRHLAEADGPASFRLLPSSAIWWFFPGFGALCFSWEITLLAWSLLGGSSRVTRFIDWTNERAGYDSTRALRWMGLLLAMPIGVATLLAIPMHSSVRDNDIVVGRYAKFTVQYLPYSQASSLAQVDGFRGRNGKFSAHAEMIVDFNNGTRWRSADNRDFTPEPDPGLAEFLQLKTGLPVGHFETEADLRAQTR
jgi:hypothetical protein